MANTATSPAHTQGPWTLTNHTEIVADDGHESLIAEVFDERNDWKANARLIAAAPKLLDLLKQVYEGMQDGSINECESSLSYDV